MFEKLGDLRSQLNWIALTSSSIAALSFFSRVFGEAGDNLSDFFSRIVLSFNVIFDKLWNYLSKYSGIDLYLYGNKLTFVSIVIFPYLIFLKKVRYKSIFEDDKFVLALLNMSSISIISGLIDINRTGSGIQSIPFFEVVVSFLPYALSILALSTYSLYVEFDYRTKLKIFIILIFIFINCYLLYNIITEYEWYSEINSHALLYSILSIIAGFVFTVAIFFQIDGKYPFLFFVIMYIVLYIINYTLKNFFPYIDKLLASMGA